MGKYIATVRPVLGKYIATERPVLGKYIATVRPVLGKYIATVRPVLGIYIATVRPVLGKYIATEGLGFIDCYSIKLLLHIYSILYIVMNKNQYSEHPQNSTKNQ